MKANKFLLGLFTATALFVVSCASDDTSDVNINLGNGSTNPTGTEIGGTLTENLTLTTGTEYRSEERSEGKEWWGGVRNDGAANM